LSFNCNIYAIFMGEGGGCSLQDTCLSFDRSMKSGYSSGLSERKISIQLMMS
jgi:hypothetical protein